MSKELNSIDSINTSSKIGKPYLHFTLFKNLAYGLVDSGAEVSIMTHSFFLRLVKEYSPKKIPLESENMTIRSYSGNGISVKGRVKISMRLSQNISLDHEFIVVDCNSYPILFGSDFIQKFDELTFKPKESKMSVVYNGTYFETNIKYLFSQETNIVEVEASLKPRIATSVTYKLPYGFNVFPHEQVLTTTYSSNGLIAVPSFSDVFLDSNVGVYQAQACFVNMKTKHETLKATVHLEINDEELGYFDNDNGIKTFRKYVRKYPFLKDVIKTYENSHHDFPTINEIEINEVKENKRDYIPSDLELLDSLTLENVQEIIEPTKGFSTAEELTKERSIEEIVDLNEVDPQFREYVKDIFIDSYPEVISKHEWDCGDITKYVGQCTLKLKDNETYPKNKKIYALNQEDQKKLEELLSFMVKLNLIRPAPDFDSMKYGVPSYVIPKKSGKIRLIIDYSHVNKAMACPIQVIPQIDENLESMRGFYFVTSFDLAQAFYSVSITEESKQITNFVTKRGVFQYNRLPTGLLSSPTLYTDRINKVLNTVPMRDKDGNVIWEDKEKTKAKLIEKPLKKVRAYIDDLVVPTEYVKSYAESLKYHFHMIKLTAERLALHNARISWPKTQLAQTKVKYLGWILSNNGLIEPDPVRIQVIKNFPEPKNLKGLRSFCGSITAIRKVIPLKILEKITVLNQLLSTKKEFIFTDVHRAAFEDIKKALVSEPLFTTMLDPILPKIIFCDASTGAVSKGGSPLIGSVLCQVKQNDLNEMFMCQNLDVRHPIDNYIHRNNLRYKPLPVRQRHDSELKLKPTTGFKHSDDNNFGYSDYMINDTLFHATKVVLFYYNCRHNLEYSDLRDMAMANLKGDALLKAKIRDTHFSGNMHLFTQYIQKVSTGQEPPDPLGVFAAALSNSLHRPFIIIYEFHPQHGKDYILKLNFENFENPLSPVILGARYNTENQLIYLPYALMPDNFEIASLKDKIQIVSYQAQSLPASYSHHPIIHLEAMSILAALHHFKKYIMSTETYLLTDSKALYFLFSKPIAESSVKLIRWQWKLKDEYPHIKFIFVETKNQIADFLSRFGYVEEKDKKHLKIKPEDFSILDFSTNLPKSDFTITEWIEWVASNPQYASLQPEETVKFEESVVNEIYSDQIENYLTPFKILQERLSRQNFILEQNREFSDIITKCMQNEDFTYFAKNRNKVFQFILKENLLLVHIKKERTGDERKVEDLDNGIDSDISTPKIVTPSSLIDLIISFYHLKSHGGIKKILIELTNYYFPQKYIKILRFVNTCYGCFLQNRLTRREHIGFYPLPKCPMNIIHLDLLENLNNTKVGRFYHILVCVCPLSDFTLLFPLRDKKSSTIHDIILEKICLQFPAVSILITDNGAAFTGIADRFIRHQLRIDFIQTAALHPSGHGKIESQVKIVKYLMKKLLAYRDNNYWDHMPYIISKTLNSTISPRTGFTPNQLVFGPSNTDNWLSTEPLEHSTEYFANVPNQYKHKVELMPKMIQLAKDSVDEIRTTQNKKKNESRVFRVFNPGDIVYEIDKTYVPGAGRPLNTLYDPSPFVVKQVYFTTIQVQRIADGVVVIYSKDRIKKYTGEPNVFSHLPREIKEKFLGNFDSLNIDDINEITKVDNLQQPDANDLNKNPLFDNNTPLSSLPNNDFEEDYIHFDDEEIERKNIHWPNEDDLEEVQLYSDI